MRGTTNRLNNEKKEKLISMYEEGKMDSEIAKELDVTHGAILYWRKKLNLVSKFTYSKISKIDNSKFEELFNQGLSDSAIAKQLNMTSDGIYAHRMKHNYFRESLSVKKPIELTDFQKQVLLGTLLGDSSMRIPKGGKNPSISCAHGIKQKEYCEYKTKIFESLGANCTYHKRNLPDKRNGIFYEDYTMNIPANPELLSWYYALYKDKKVIPFELFDNFTEVSLAFMFMDDGSKVSSSYTIATNCFELSGLIKFQAFLKERFNLNTSILGSKVLYIKANSRNLFTYLISPYICECMKYKLIVS